MHVTFLHTWNPNDSIAEVETKWVPDKQSLERPMPWDLSQDLSIYFPMAGTVTESCFDRVHETVEFGDPVALKEVVILWSGNYCKITTVFSTKNGGKCVCVWACVRYCWMFFGALYTSQHISTCIWWVPRKRRRSVAHFDVCMEKPGKRSHIFWGILEAVIPRNPIL